MKIVLDLAEYSSRTLRSWLIWRGVSGTFVFAVSSSLRPWMDVFALPEKSNMAVTESDPDPKARKMSITF